MVLLPVTSLPLPGNALVTTSFEMLIAGLALAAFGLIRGERMGSQALATEAMVAWAYLVVASIVAFGAYTWLIGHAPMSLVATFAYVNPVIAVVLGSVIAHEPFTLDVAVGMTVVVGGVALVLVGERRR